MTTAARGMKKSPMIGASQVSLWRDDWNYFFTCNVAGFVPVLYDQIWCPSRDAESADGLFQFAGLNCFRAEKSTAAGKWHEEHEVENE